MGGFVAYKLPASASDFGVSGISLVYGFHVKCSWLPLSDRGNMTCRILSINRIPET